MPDAHDDEVIRAAGAIVWRPGLAGPEFALVHRPSYDDWSYPKGKCHREEHVLVAAIREVTEETGLKVILGRPLTPSVYQVSGRTKQVRYWVARCAESLDFVPNAEVDRVAWVPAAAAREQLSYARDVELLDELRAAPVRTAPLILLRHANAGRKTAARGTAADLARPLDGRGEAEAKLLAGLLASYGPCRVVSSPAERCLATVRPYAAATGAVVEIEPVFSAAAAAMTGADTLLAGIKAGGGGKKKKRQEAGLRPAEPGPQPADLFTRQAAERAASLAASGVPTVICAHRENLPALIAAACGALGGDQDAQASRPLRKGAFLVLQSAGGVLVSAEWQELAA